jgi:hypothetical protein
MFVAPNQMSVISNRASDIQPQSGMAEAWGQSSHMTHGRKYGPFDEYLNVFTDWHSDSLRRKSHRRAAFGLPSPDFFSPVEGAS